MASVRPPEDFRARLERTVLAPMGRAGSGYFLWVAFLLAVLGWGLYAYSTQLREGLVVTALRDRILWGMYITLFVFFIGISHAGTLISAILRASQAGWRTPITRMAEFITVVALMTGAFMPIIDLGRPDRVVNVLLHGRWQSPLLWDVLAISTYLTGSFIYLYLPMIPDLALVRDRLSPEASAIKRRIYTLLAIGWRNTPKQKRYLGIAVTMMMVAIIPVAVSVHTVVSWIFAMTLREPWNNPMFGAFFVAGAIYSGLAALIILMAILRRAFRLQEYLTPRHFVYLGYLLGALSLLMAYFNASEFVTTGYKMAGEAPFHFQNMFTGKLAPFYWAYSLGGLLLPGLIILLPWTRNMTGVLVAAVLALIAMWLERYFIVVGGLMVPLMPYEPASYFPSWVEWSVMAGAFAWFTLIITLAVKVIPVVAVWEVAEQHEEREQRVSAEMTAVEAPSGMLRGLASRFRGTP